MPLYGLLWPFYGLLWPFMANYPEIIFLIGLVSFFLAVIDPNSFGLVTSTKRSKFSKIE